MKNNSNTSSRSALKFPFKVNSRSASKFSFDASSFKDSLIAKTTITILVVVSFLLLPKVGFLPIGAEGFEPLRNIIFPLSHANIFHLLCNILCLWQMRKINAYIAPAFIIQLICSLLPELLHDIMGMSGFLFAIIGLKCGVKGIGVKMVKAFLPFFVVSLFIPNVAFLYHLYCISVAYAIGSLYDLYRLWKALRL